MIADIIICYRFVVGKIYAICVLFIRLFYWKSFMREFLRTSRFPKSKSVHLQWALPIGAHLWSL